jgi:hypothetical protein
MKNVTFTRIIKKSFQILLILLISKVSSFSQDCPAFNKEYGNKCNNALKCDLNSRYNSTMGKWRIPVYFYKGGKKKKTSNELSQMIREVNDVFSFNNVPIEIFDSGSQDFVGEKFSFTDNRDLVSKANAFMGATYKNDRIVVYLLDNTK